MTKPDLLPDDLKYWWADDEEGPYKGPFDSRDLAIDDAYCYRAECFDDPSQKDGLYLLHGKNYPNPEYSEDYPRDDFDNPPEHISGKPEYVTALNITDEFHKAWNTRAPNKPAEVDLDAFETWAKKSVSCVLEKSGKANRHYISDKTENLYAAFQAGHLATAKGGDDE